MVTAKDIENAFKPHTDSDTNKFLDILRTQGNVIEIKDQSYANRSNGEPKIMVKYSGRLERDLSGATRKLRSYDWYLNAYKYDDYDNVTRVWFIQL